MGIIKRDCNLFIVILIFKQACVFLKDRNSELDLQSLQEKIAYGDQSAFAALYGLFQRRLIAFSNSLVHSKEIAEEVVEDAFVKLWTRRSSISEIENLAVYLYVAVKNLSLNKLSERAKQLISRPFDDIETEVEAISDDPYSLLITAEILSKMNKAVDELPPRCKIIFKLVREDGLRYKEVAEILNISVNTIDAQMAIAVKRLCLAMGVHKKSNAKIHGHAGKKN